jgi:hypothetical protein
LPPARSQSALLVNLWLDGVDGEPVDGAGAGVPGVLGVAALGGVLGETEVPLPDVPLPEVEPGALVPSLLVCADANAGARPMAMTKPARMSFFTVRPPMPRGLRHVEVCFAEEASKGIARNARRGNRGRQC